MKLAFIINEHAGNGNGRRVWQKVKSALTIPYEAHISQYAKHAYLLAREITERAKNERPQTLLIVIGGDGTVHEVVNGCANADNIIIGHMRGGSGNDFARGFFAFNSVKDIEAFLQNPHFQTVDIGQIQNARQQRFINNCGIGFDAYVGLKANASKVKKWLNKWKLGKLGYVYYVVLGLFLFKPFSLTVKHGEKVLRYDKVWFATVSNQPYFGGGMKISPKSVVTDGKLELTVVHNLSRRKFITMFITVFFGMHTRFREVVQLSGERFALQFDRILPCHADGENIHNNNLDLAVKVMPHALKIVKKLSE